MFRITKVMRNPIRIKFGHYSHEGFEIKFIFHKTWEIILNPKTNLKWPNKFKSLKKSIIYIDNHYSYISRYAQALDIKNKNPESGS